MTDHQIEALASRARQGDHGAQAELDAWVDSFLRQLGSEAPLGEGEAAPADIDWERPVCCGTCSGSLAG